MLNGPSGVFASALSPPATAYARIAGGEAVPTFIVEVRAPPDFINTAEGQVRSELLTLSTTVSEAHLAWALHQKSRRRLEARMDPRQRLADLWNGRERDAPSTPTLTAWRGFLAATFREPSFVVVVGRRE